MLARRVITRPATTIRLLGASQVQRRFIHPSVYQSQTLPRPNTWLQKFRFRADGKPRSKLIALGFGSLIVSQLSLFYKLIKAIEYGEGKQQIMADMILVQHIDSTYDSVNFDDFISTLSYFIKLEQYYLGISEEQADIRMENLNRKYFIEGAATRERAHQVMRSAAEKIHVAFRELDRDSHLKTCQKLSLAMTWAMLDITILVTEILEEDIKKTESLIREIDSR